MAGLALGPANRTELRCGGAEAPLPPARTGTMLPDLASQADPPAPAQPPLDGVCGVHWQNVPRALARAVILPVVSDHCTIASYVEPAARTGSQVDDATHGSQGRLSDRSRPVMTPQKHWSRSCTAPGIHRAWVCPHREQSRATGNAGSDPWRASSPTRRRRH